MTMAEELSPLVFLFSARGRMGEPQRADCAAHGVRQRKVAMVSRLSRVLLGLIVVVSLLPASASAQTADPHIASAAQALFDQANEEMEAGAFASACPKLEEATKLIPDALGARMALGECYEGLGRLASAWSQYAMVEGLAAKANQSERAQAAGQRARDLKPRLASLTIDVGSGAGDIAGLVITRDGLAVGKAQWGVAFPADVGSHEIAANAPGYKGWHKTIEILADGAATTVKVPVLAEDPKSRPAPKSTAVAPGDERPWQMPVAFAAMAAGGASLMVGAIVGGLAIARNDESNERECNAANQCSAAGLALRDEAVGLGNASTAMFVVGGVLAAGGVALFFTTPAWLSGDETTALRIGPTGLRLQGSF